MNHPSNTTAGFASQAIHHAHDAQANKGALTPPLHLTSTFAFAFAFAFETAQTGGEMFAGERAGHVFSRNSNMRLVDIKGASQIAHAHGARVVVNNIYASPSLTRPIELGADLVLHSATKYLGGHGDDVAGRHDCF